MRTVAFRDFFLFTFVFFAGFVPGQKAYTHADSLKGTISAERTWWDVLHYGLDVSFHDKDSSISGSNAILYRVLDSSRVLQLDLMAPMQLDSVVQDGKICSWRRDGNAFLIEVTLQAAGTEKQATAYFHGRPQRAVLPPWDGGMVWEKDRNNAPWISIACQGIGASVWFPNKDHQYDEADSASVRFTANAKLVAVSNGRLRSQKINGDGTATWYWAVVNPINNYNIIPYIGRYVNFKDTLHGKAGVLDLDFWVLEYNLARARAQFAQAKPMLRCFEDWFGPYPFYEDGYKLVESPFLGMEHQSAIAYGNKFQNGYKGQDLSLTGWGLKWDFIIIHESGHEWFANSITARDVADNWIHEGFTAYSENLYTEYLYGKKAGAEYMIGTRKGILNDRPVIGDYGVSGEGSDDMYYKSANMLHTIRQLVDNDSLWKGMFRALNTAFRHQTVTTQQVEGYMCGFLKMDLGRVFDQYLRTAKIPVLEYRIGKKELQYRWSNCVPGFDMPVRLEGKESLWLRPTESWQTMSYNLPGLAPQADFYIKTKKIK